MLIESIFLQELSQGIIQQSTLTYSQICSHSKDRFFQKKRERRIFSIKGLGTRGIGLVLLRLLKKKKHQSKFSIPWKNSRFPNFSKKKKSSIKNFYSFKKFRISKNFQKNKKIQKSKKKIFIKFFFENRKLWFFSTFSSDATSSQLSTLSIHRSMEYVPN